MCKYLLEHTSFMIYGTLRYRTTKLTNAKEYFPDNPRFTMLHMDITDNVNVLNNTYVHTTTGEVISRVNPDYYRPAEVRQLMGDNKNTRLELY